MASRSPLPETDWEETAGFWEAAARGELAVPRCQGCGRLVWYPKPKCPDCGGDDFAWSALSGRGTLFSWAVVERALFKPFAEKAPYVPGLVALEEDPRVRIVTDLVDVAPDALRVDMPVEVVFRPIRFEGDEREVVGPFFRPAKAAGG